MHDIIKRIDRLPNLRLSCDRKDTRKDCNKTRNEQRNHQLIAFVNFIRVKC